MDEVVKIRNIFHHPVHFVAFGFGSGLLPKAPGTWGTMAAIPIYLLLSSLPLWLYGAILLFLIIFAIYACGVTAKDLGAHDYPGIVLDEVVGFLLTMIAMPKTWLAIATGFVLFRIFDIWKPWPIGWVNKRVNGGFGIVLDDLLAAIFAWLMLQVLLYVWLFYE
jgi:phosphatidylglycerophosphatase A